MLNDEKNFRLPTFIILGILLWIPALVSGEITLPRLFQDGMVLQRGEASQIWGRADPDETLKVNFQDECYYATGDKSGNWRIVFKELRAGGPFTLSIEGGHGEDILLTDVYVGDVWVCSGQSNMELSMKRLKFAFPEEIASARNERIRQFVVPDHYDFNVVRTDLDSGEWSGSTPQSVLDFTAVGYFFAKYIQASEDIPIGLVNAALGGAPVQAWMSEEALSAFPSDLEEAHKWADPALVASTLKRNDENSRQWYALVEKADRGTKDGDFLYADPSTDVSEWEEIRLPGTFDQGSIKAEPGLVWLRKDFAIDELDDSDPKRLWLGRIVDADKVFINGQFVGETTYQYPPRIYELPDGLLREGMNTLVVRVVVNGADGRFIEDKPYYLDLGSRRIDLRGNWRATQYSVEEPAPSTVFVRWKPLGLYNAMIAPLTDFNVKGVIWYQGEANTHEPDRYENLFKTMIRDWRAKWYKGGELPFLFVQLANLGRPPEEPGTDGWAELREAQTRVLELPHTCMAVSYDLGEWNDIHPLDKKTVGYRLSLCARSQVYGESDLISSGPTYRSHVREGDALRVFFENTADGLVPKKPGKVHGFAIAGEDGEFHWATGTVEGDSVVLTSPHVSAPVDVRFAWAMNPATANLKNSAGLPAVPFRTDP